MRKLANLNIQTCIYTCNSERTVNLIMKPDKITTTPTDTPPMNIYDDGNIPAVDLPKSNNLLKEPSVEPMPESSRPRKDGPGRD